MDTVEKVTFERVAEFCDRVAKDLVGFVGLWPRVELVSEDSSQVVLKLYYSSEPTARIRCPREREYVIHFDPSLPLPATSQLPTAIEGFIGFFRWQFPGVEKLTLRNEPLPLTC